MVAETATPSWCATARFSSWPITAAATAPTPAGCESSGPSWPWPAWARTTTTAIRIRKRSACCAARDCRCCGPTSSGPITITTDGRTLAGGRADAGAAADIPRRRTSTASPPAPTDATGRRRLASHARNARGCARTDADSGGPERITRQRVGPSLSCSGIHRIDRHERARDRVDHAARPVHIERAERRAPACGLGAYGSVLIPGPLVADWGTVVSARRRCTGALSR